jgi:uncharacterized protein YxjI
MAPITDPTSPSSFLSMSYQQPGGGWPAPAQPQQPQQPYPQQPQQPQQPYPQQPQQPQQPAQHPPGWYPDPFGRHETRWWDGSRWTEHVASHGRRSVDAPSGGSQVPVGNESQDKVARQVQKVGAATGAQGGGTIFTEPVLVVNQKAKLIEVNTEFAVFNQHGQQIGAIRQVGQSAGKKLLRAVTNLDAMMSHKFQIVDGWGNVQLAISRPASMWKSRFQIQNAHGQEVGQIVQEKMLGKPSFGMESGGHRWGQMILESWRDRSLKIEDHTGAEIARVSRVLPNLAKFVFTKADNWVIQIHRPLEDPMRSLVVATALSVDLVYTQHR